MAAKGSNCSELSSLCPSSNSFRIYSEHLCNLCWGQKNLWLCTPLHPYSVYPAVNWSCLGFKPDSLRINAMSSRGNNDSKSAWLNFFPICYFVQKASILWFAEFIKYRIELPQLLWLIVCTRRVGWPSIKLIVLRLCLSFPVTHIENVEQDPQVWITTKHLL